MQNFLGTKQGPNHPLLALKKKGAVTNKQKEKRRGEEDPEFKLQKRRTKNRKIRDSPKMVMLVAPEMAVSVVGGGRDIRDSPTTEKAGKKVRVKGFRALGE